MKIRMMKNRLGLAMGAVLRHCGRISCARLRFDDIFWCERFGSNGAGI